MKANLATIKKLESSFLSCEKDYEEVLKKLFIESQPHSEELKRLLVINTKNCLDKNNTYYNQILSNYDLATLKEQGHIKLEPKISFPENEEVKSYIVITTDNFTPNQNNPHYRDCTLSFDIICHTDYWDLGNYQVRPLKIAGYIDSLLNKTKLSGIGTLNFLGCSLLILNERMAGYTLNYTAIHGNDDVIPVEEDA